MTRPIAGLTLETLNHTSSPSADLIGTTLSCVDASRRPDLMSADELDAYHGFPSLRPITIRNAGLLLREAEKAHQASITKAIEAKKAYEYAVSMRDEARLKVEKAVDQLRISALQPNGGEV